MSGSVWDHVAAVSNQLNPPAKHTYDGTKAHSLAHQIQHEIEELVSALRRAEADVRRLTIERDTARAELAQVKR